MTVENLQWRVLHDYHIRMPVLLDGYDFDA